MPLLFAKAYKQRLYLRHWMRDTKSGRCGFVFMSATTASNSPVAYCPPLVIVCGPQLTPATPWCEPSLSGLAFVWKIYPVVGGVAPNAHSKAFDRSEAGSFQTACRRF